MIVGTIRRLIAFLNADEEMVLHDKISEDKIILEKNRKYYIPFYQRQIRWTSRNVSSLISDIKRSDDKLLGNIILNRSETENSFEIIDGQQRITILLMILNYLFAKLDSNFIKPVGFEINSFKQYHKLVGANYDEASIPETEKQEYEDSDDYSQRNDFIEIYSTIRDILDRLNPRELRDFTDNLKKAKINLIVSKGEQDRGTDFFLDVNLKGIKLETEDIFKGYYFKIISTFSNVAQAKIDWENLKKAHNSLDERQRKVYPLCTLIEHYIRCTLTQEAGYANIEMNSNFELTRDISINGTQFYLGDHLLSTFGDHRYPQKVVCGLTRYINNIYKKAIIGDMGSFKTLYEGVEGMDDTTKELSFKCVQSVLKGNYEIAKAVIMKYGIELLSVGLTKVEHKRVFAAYFFSILFSVLEASGKKDMDKVLSVLKGTKDQWPRIAMQKGLAYFDSAEFEEKKAHQRYLVKRPQQEQNLYLAKSLALIYNCYTNIKADGSFNINEKIARDFLSSPDYSVEHLFINNSGKVKIGSNEVEVKYHEDIRKIKDSLYNFIFVPEDINGRLANLDMNRKLSVLQDGIQSIKCEYSKKLLQIIADTFLFPDWTSVIEIEDAETSINNFFSVGNGSNYEESFLPMYSKFAGKVLDAVKDKITAH